MRTNKNTSKIILAGIVAVLATMISYSAFSNMQNELSEQKKLIDFMQKNPAGESTTFAYAVATTNLKAGEIVAEQDVDFQNFDIEDKTAFENRSDVVNKVLLQDITSGSVFTSAHIAKISNDNQSLKEGYRALTLPADSFQGKSNKMTEGSYVDIYSASGESPWVLENVKILSFESQKKSEGDPATQTSNGIMDASAVTFEVSAGEISDFISNVSKSKLVLVTRGSNDKKVVFKKTKTKSYSSSAASSAMSSLPNLPASVPITDLNSSSGFSGLPDPIQPMTPQSSVEVIEANVKSKVTFD